MQRAAPDESAWPLRNLLLAVYVGLLGAALLAVSVGIYSLVERFLERAQNRSALLVTQEAWIRLGLPSTEFRGPGPNSGLRLGKSVTQSQLQILVADLARPERPVRWRDPRRNVVFMGGGSPSASYPDPPELQWWALRIDSEYGYLGTLEIGVDRRPDHNLMRALRRYLLACSAGVLLLAVGLCWRLAARWLTPLQTLALTLESLAGGDLSARAPEIGGPMVPAEWRSLRQSANDMAERLEASFVAQRRFVSDASHELRTPLTAISAMAEMLESDDLPAQGRAKAETTIRRESRRMSRLVEDLLALSRAEEAPSQNKDPICQLDSLWSSLLEEFGEQFPGRQIEISGDQSVTVNAPAPLVRTVLRNLVENALRYSDGIVTCRVSSDAQKVFIEVEDQGCGIPDEDLERVFDRFYRADHSRTRATGGSGLGLALVRALVRTTGGNVKLSSEVGVGTKVRLSWKRANSA